jgi:hypothetical protein
LSDENDKHREEDIIAEFEERIAIMTIDGEAKERDAVRHAYAELRRRYGISNVPEYVKQKVREAMSQE